MADLDAALGLGGGGADVAPVVEQAEDEEKKEEKKKDQSSSEVSQDSEEDWRRMGAKLVLEGEEEKEKEKKKKELENPALDEVKERGATRKRSVTIAGTGAMRPNSAKPKDRPVSRRVGSTANNVFAERGLSFLSSKPTVSTMTKVVTYFVVAE